MTLLRPTDAATSGIRLGLRVNLAQFGLLVAVNALVGGMLGQERTVLPLLADRTFHLSAYTAALTYIVAFGVSKALANFAAGALSDRLGRKPVLVAGWLLAAPVPLLLIWAPSWNWVVLANVLLGVSQGLTWSTTVIMKIDLAGSARRGLAMGLNEASGYAAVAATAMATGAVAAHAGLRPGPFLLGIAYAALGLGLSVFAVRETLEHSRAEAARLASGGPGRGEQLSTGQVARLASFEDRALSSASWAGMVNNLNDALAWGVFPLLYAAHGLTVGRIGLLAALYPAVWGAGQLVTGWLSDRIGRKRLITAGMLVQAAAIGLVALGSGFPVWALAQVLLGVGTAMVYPTLLAVVGDVAHPSWRARAVGVYRLWRDGGFAVGALLAGAVADACGLVAAVWTVAALTAAAGLVVAVRMRETHRTAPAAAPEGPAGRRACGSARWVQYPGDTPGGNRKVLVMLKEVDIEAFAAARAAGALVLDVREHFEFVMGHVPGARSTPLGMLAGCVADLPRDRPVMVICASGNRSQVGAELLARAGHDAASVRGGTAAWQRSGHDLVAGTV